MNFDFDWCLEPWEKPDDIRDRHFPFQDLDIQVHGNSGIVRICIEARTEHAALLVRQTLELQGYDPMEYADHG